MTTTLGELAALIRSKNAGPFMLTFDVMFDDPAVYARVRDAGVITREAVAGLFSQPLDTIEIYWVEAALAVKVSFPRPTIQGSLDDTDMHGGQQFCQFLDMNVP
jgi:hypothetical protein